jgi:adenylate cyclase
MAIEIERKFTLKNDSWRTQVERSSRIRQGYLVSGMEAGQPSSVRIRISNSHASLNIKSVVLGSARHEFEYSIPLDDAEYMLEQLCKPHLIEKTRHIVVHAGHRWEIDVFEGVNQGLEMAEIELQSIDTDFELPDWAGDEVTDDLRYYNIYLVDKPYSLW